MNLAISNNTIFTKYDKGIYIYKLFKFYRNKIILNPLNVMNYTWNIPLNDISCADILKLKAKSLRKNIKALAPYCFLQQGIKEQSLSKK